MESLAAQTPIIGARIGGIPELIEEGATGFVFASGDVDSLSWSMREASKQSENVYMEMQKKCFRYIDDNCRQNKYIKELVDFYARVL